MSIELRTAHWKELTGTGVKVIVLDSGVNADHPDIARHSLSNGAAVCVEDEGFCLKEDFRDTQGHGTAIASIIKRLAPDADIYTLKIFHDRLEVQVEHLLFALEHVLHSLEGHILHLSLGVTYGGDIARMRELINALQAKGMIIVSAFDNSGSVSYPAGFDHVIGVDASFSCKGDYEYEFVEGDMVNLRAKGSNQRLAWVDPLYIFRGGASFAAAYVTGYAAKLIEGGMTNRSDILAALKQEAKRVHAGSEAGSRDRSCGPIQRAVLFPLNKEMHSLLRFQDQLTFAIHAVCDVKYSGQVGQAASKVIRSPLDNDPIVQNIESLDWESDFDTLILGHVGWLSQSMRSDLVEKMLALCIEHGKNAYCFDGLDEYAEWVERAREKGLRFYFPKVEKEDVPPNRFGKLRRVGKPVLGVFGTSSRQGKFTLQLTLRRLFQRDGYRVGQLGTEPSALLYGFDEVYPVGYNSTVRVTAYQAVQVLNDMMSRIEDQDPEIIIVGAQSGTVPYDFGHVSQFTFPTFDVLMGTDPDAYVLAVNMDDDPAYVRRTVQVLENLGRGKVIGLSVFPLRKQVLPWAGTKMNFTVGEEIEAAKQLFRAELGIEAYALHEQDDMEALYQKVVDFFG